MNESPAFLCGLLRRRPCVLPTLRGSLLLLLLSILAAIGVVRGAYPFLAVNDPVLGGVLVAEGWGPDFFIREVSEEFKRGHYWGLCVTGGPLEKGSMLIEYKTSAELAGATLLKMNFDPKALHVVPSAEVRKDRTYASALALKQWLSENHVSSEKINIMTLGAHARRTRLLFEKAFGKDSRVGIVAVEDKSFPPQEWWSSSNGFRGVMDEMFAYCYARFLFQPANG